MAKKHQMAIQCLQDKAQYHREMAKEFEAAIGELDGGNSTGPRGRGKRPRWRTMDLAVEAMREAGGEMMSAEIHEKIKAKKKVKLKSFKTMLSLEAKEGNRIEKVKGRPGLYRLAQAG